MVEVLDVVRKVSMQAQQDVELKGQTLSLR